MISTLERPRWVWVVSIALAALLASCLIGSQGLLSRVAVSLGYNPFIPTMALDVERYPPAPADLTLEQVHVYMRHGERTPVRARLQDPPASMPVQWNLCKAANDFYSAVNDPSRPVPVIRVPAWGDGSQRDGDCMLGQLTDVGRKTTYDFGQALRELYIRRLSFLPNVLDREGVTYYRSTNVPRTIESLQQVMVGLYPSDNVKETLQQRILIRHGSDENLVGNMMGCPRLQALDRMFMAAAAVEHNPALAALNSKFSKYIHNQPVRIDGHPRASGILDTIKAAKAHGLPVPKEFNNSEDMDLLERAVCAEWYDGYKTQEFRKLGMGRLLDELKTRMQKKAASGRSDPLKIAVLSCHDTSIAGLCTTLDVFDNKWPPFMASVTFELFKQEDRSSEGSWLFWQQRSSKHFIRMRYKDQTMVLPACAAPGDHLQDHPEFCTLDAFSRRVAELTPKDWVSECATTTNSSKSS